MDKLRVLDLFSGIGGFSLGLERTGGFETVAFCEIEEFPRRVLAKHWPEVPQYEDVRELTGKRLAADGIAVDVITGGFPCQDLSLAGSQKGMGEGTRSGLWSEIIRLAGELQPKYIFVENVANLLSGPSEQPGGWFSRVLGDLAERGYDAEWRNIPAWMVGAPHVRERVWLVAYPKNERQSEARELRHKQPEKRLSSGSKAPVFADDLQERIQGGFTKTLRGFSGFSWCENVRSLAELRERSPVSQPLIRGSRDGIPDWVDRLSALGNAVVPQIPEMIGHAILARELAIREGSCNAN